MDFGGALTALKRGKIVSRSGWNGKGMWLVLIPGDVSGADNLARSLNLRADHLKADRPGAMVKITPCIAMFTAQGDIAPGWLASQADMLSEDWEVVE